MRCHTRERQYHCGEYLDVDIYPVYRKAGQRGKKAKPTTAVQQKLNDRRAEERLIRLVHTNFTPADIALHLTYRPEQQPADEQAAKREVQNYLRRLKRMRDKLRLPPLKYICVTEKKGAGYHHHLIVSGGLDRDSMENLWGRGYANADRLQFEPSGLAGLSRYIGGDPAKKDSERVGRKKWNGSQNLAKPVERVRSRISQAGARQLCRLAESRLDMTRQIAQLYPGFSLIEARPYHNECNGGWYIALRLVRLSFLHRIEGRAARGSTRPEAHPMPKSGGPA